MLWHEHGYFVAQGKKYLMHWSKFKDLVCFKCEVSCGPSYGKLPSRAGVSNTRIGMNVSEHICRLQCHVAVPQSWSFLFSVDRKFCGFGLLCSNLFESGKRQLWVLYVSMDTI